MAGYYLIVGGDQMMARDTVYSALRMLEFKISELDTWSARAERGSQAASLMLGALAGKKGRHLKMLINCASDPNGNLAITLTQETSGISGGLLGKKQADDTYSEVYETLRATFANAGVLIAANPQ